MTRQLTQPSLHIPTNLAVTKTNMLPKRCYGGWLAFLPQTSSDWPGNITVDAHHSSTQHVGTHHTCLGRYEIKHYNMEDGLCELCGETVRYSLYDILFSHVHLENTSIWSKGLTSILKQPKAWVLSLGAVNWWRHSTDEYHANVSKGPRSWSGTNKA